MPTIKTIIMKKLLFGLYIMSLFFLFTSCNNDNEDASVNSNEIRLQAKVESTDLKASLGPLNESFSTSFPIGVYAYNTDWLEGSSANVINNDQATVDGTGLHAVTFGSGPYYYPADGSPLNFFAFAPRGTEVTEAGNGTPPFVDISINGQDDVMWCTSTGYKSGSNAAQTPILNFAHKLTQLQFTFKADTSYPSSGSVVTSLLVKAQPDVVNMNVETGDCTYSGSADMEAIAPDNQSAGLAITAAGANANSPVITAPASGATAYSLTIVVKPAGSSTTVTYNANVNITTVIGSAHMITLNFTRTAVTATTTVADWAPGTGGSVTVL